MKRLALAALILLLLSCDTREAFHRPDPSWSRMLQQRRADPYAASGAFEDGKTMREPVPDTIARDEPDPTAPRAPVTRALLERGRVHFETICATCHGIAGDGNSVVATKMRSRPPPSLHEDRIRALSNDAVLTVVEHGYGWMPSYADRLDASERWEVVAYLRALQLSRHADVAALPDSVRATLAKEAP